MKMSVEKYWKHTMFVGVILLKGSILMVLLLFFLYFLQTEQWLGIGIVWAIILLFDLLDSNAIAKIKETE